MSHSITRAGYIHIQKKRKEHTENRNEVETAQLFTVSYLNMVGCLWLALTETQLLVKIVGYSQFTYQVRLQLHIKLGYLSAKLTDSFEPNLTSDNFMDHSVRKMILHDVKISLKPSPNWRSYALVQSFKNIMHERKKRKLLIELLSKYLRSELSIVVINQVKSKNIITTWKTPLWVPSQFLSLLPFHN